MKLTLTLITLIGLAAANPRPQLPTPDTPPPPLTSHAPPETNDDPKPPPTTSTTSTTSTSKGGPPPDPTKAPPPTSDGPICECGYTYCASVLMGMKKAWSQKQLAEAYCSTPNASCNDHVPATNVTSALYICLCDDPDQEVGENLDLVCGCDKCLNIGPDFRGRCETPCHAGNCQMQMEMQM